MNLGTFLAQQILSQNIKKQLLKSHWSQQRPSRLGNEEVIILLFYFIHFEIQS